MTKNELTTARDFIASRRLAGLSTDAVVEELNLIINGDRAALTALVEMIPALAVAAGDVLAPLLNPVAA